MFNLGELVISQKVKEENDLQEISKAVSIYEKLAKREKTVEGYQMEFYNKKELSFIISTLSDYSKTTVITPLEYSTNKLQDFFMEFSLTEIMILRSILENLQEVNKNHRMSNRKNGIYQKIIELEMLKIMYDLACK